MRTGLCSEGPGVELELGQQCVTNGCHRNVSNCHFEHRYNRNTFTKTFSGSLVRDTSDLECTPVSEKFEVEC